MPYCIGEPTLLLVPTPPCQIAWGFDNAASVRRIDGGLSLLLVDLPLDAVGAFSVLFQGTTAMALPKAKSGIAVVGFGNQQIERTSAHSLVSNRTFSTPTKPVSVNPVGRKEPLIVMVSLDVPF